MLFPKRHYTAKPPVAEAFCFLFSRPCRFDGASAGDLQIK
jgi:hypothetical protein